ncbi:MAG: hypothetical protein PHF00_13450 [Elusimicrobia bacterium]|nr:hypothetical protein [Elusimicrobiota bacterium]
MTPDKISLLMEETGCDKGEAELALEMCGFVVEDAVKAIPRLHKSVVVFKGKLAHSEENLFGLLLVILNVRSRSVLRSRAVLSFNPAVCSVGLEKDWFEFEKYLYGCRLWEGSLPKESLELEQAVANHLRGGGARVFEAQAQPAHAELLDILRRVLRAPALELKLVKDVLDMGQFQSLKAALPGERVAPGGARPAAAPRHDDLLILKVSLVEDPAGLPAAELRAGDLVGAHIVDNRDIAKYLAKFFGGHSDRGPLPIPVLVEAIEGQPDRLLVRVRFSAGVCGDAEVRSALRLRAERGAAAVPEKLSWWKRLFGKAKE